MERPHFLQAKEIWRITLPSAGIIILALILFLRDEAETIIARENEPTSPKLGTKLHPDPYAIPLKNPEQESFLPPPISHQQETQTQSAPTIPDTVQINRDPNLKEDPPSHENPRQTNKSAQAIQQMLVDLTKIWSQLDQPQLTNKDDFLDESSNLVDHANTLSAMFETTPFQELNTKKQQEIISALKELLNTLERITASFLEPGRMDIPYQLTAIGAFWNFVAILSESLGKDLSPETAQHWTLDPGLMARAYKMAEADMREYFRVHLHNAVTGRTKEPATWVAHWIPMLQMSDRLLLGEAYGENMMRALRKDPEYTRHFINSAEATYRYWNGYTDDAIIESWLANIRNH